MEKLKPDVNLAGVFISFLGSFVLLEWVRIQIYSVPMAFGLDGTIIESEDDIYAPENFGSPTIPMTVPLVNKDFPANHSRVFAMRVIINVFFIRAPLIM